MAQIPSELTTHSRKVCSLYKRVIRMLDAYYTRRNEFRYHATIMRHRFDLNKNIRDARLAKALVIEGEEELFRRARWEKKRFPTAPDGIAYQRFITPNDFVLDYWNPLEKSKYPKYFALREQLKKEYVDLYKKWYPENIEESTEKKEGKN
ncbi:NADH dehydrogenase (ubiquinone) B22 subunit [Xylocopa sonorina]|uniref:NADH dehydrogenase (ubiquinone) B22 subunit n=1 Tax=Xylocopa sonorina TaxID=1818115 RepID=UPI00403A896F